MGYMQMFFWLLCLSVLIMGLLTNHMASMLPQSVVAFFHFGRAIKDLKQSAIVKRIQVPKSWFAHFYAYAVTLQLYSLITVVRVGLSFRPRELAETMSLSSVLDFLDARNEPRISMTVVVSVSFLFFIHLSRRLYENCFVSVFSGTKMNVAHYAVAFFHYTGTILAIVAHSYCFAKSPQVADSKCHGFNFSEIGFVQLLGIFLFLYGSWEQNRAHRYYANLRKGKDNHVVSLEHKIPSGGMFDWVACPNYWGEIMIYVAICVMFQFSNPTWNVISIWVIGNQTTAAIMNHNWYLRTFPNYPKNRKAIIPFLL